MVYPINTKVTKMPEKLRFTPPQPRKLASVNPVCRFHVLAWFFYSPEWYSRAASSTGTRPPIEHTTGNRRALKTDVHHDVSRNTSAIFGFPPPPPPRKHGNGRGVTNVVTYVSMEWLPLSLRNVIFLFSVKKIRFTIKTYASIWTSFKFFTIIKTKYYFI